MFKKNKNYKTAFIILTIFLVYFSGSRAISFFNHEEIEGKNVFIKNIDNSYLGGRSKQTRNNIYKAEVEYQIVPNEKDYAWIGLRNGEQFNIGDSVKFKYDNIMNRIYTGTIWGEFAPAIIIFGLMLALFGSYRRKYYWN